MSKLVFDLGDFFNDLKKYVDDDFLKRKFSSPEETVEYLEDLRKSIESTLELPGLTDETTEFLISDAEGNIIEEITISPKQTPTTAILAKAFFPYRLKYGYDSSLIRRPSTRKALSASAYFGDTTAFQFLETFDGGVEYRELLEASNASPISGRLVKKEIYELYNESYVPILEALNVKLFIDSADLKLVRLLATSSLFHGVTTNPNLLHKEEVKDYVGFADELLYILPNRPVSLQVVSEESNQIFNQGMRLSRLGENVFVSVPVITSKGESTKSAIKRLVEKGVKVNVTGVLDLEQIKSLDGVLSPDVPSFISVWVGKMSETGIDPIPIVKEMVDYVHTNFPNARVIWTSVRSVSDIFTANAIGCDIITLPKKIIDKIPNIGKTLEQFSKEINHEFLFSAKSSKLTVPNE